jgi:hydrogenase nickel incorporation protein HypA/HybF
VHELSITRNVVAIVSERAVGQRVTRVRLEIGRLSAVVPDSIRFCFDICAQGTPLEGAELEIVDSGGQELLIKEMEVEECA